MTLRVREITEIENEIYSRWRKGEKQNALAAEMNVNPCVIKTILTNYIRKKEMDYDDIAQEIEVASRGGIEDIVMEFITESRKAKRLINTRKLLKRKKTGEKITKEEARNTLKNIKKSDLNKSSKALLYWKHKETFIKALQFVMEYGK